MHSQWQDAGEFIEEQEERRLKDIHNNGVRPSDTIWAMSHLWQNLRARGSRG